MEIQLNIITWKGKKTEYKIDFCKIMMQLKNVLTLINLLKADCLTLIRK